MIYLVLFITGLLSGLSLLFFRPKKNQFIPALLSFSGAYLLGIAILHLVPEVYEREQHGLGMIVLAGFFLQLILDYFSGGIEHGHVHAHQSKIGKFPFLVVFSLGIHAFVEATPLQIDETGSVGHFDSYFVGLLFHKIPIALVLVSLLLSYHLSRPKVVLGLIIFSLMAPLGVLVGSYFSEDSTIYGYLLALAVGIILHLSTTILLETNDQHQVNWRKITPMVIGALLAVFTSGAH